MFFPLIYKLVTHVSVKMFDFYFFFIPLFSFFFFLSFLLLSIFNIYHICSKSARETCSILYDCASCPARPPPTAHRKQTDNHEINRHKATATASHVLPLKQQKKTPLFVAF